MTEQKGNLVSVILALTRGRRNRPCAMVVMGSGVRGPCRGRAGSVEAAYNTLEGGVLSGGTSDRVVMSKAQNNGGGGQRRGCVLP